MSTPRRLSRSPNTYRGAQKLPEKPSWVAKRIASILEKKNFKKAASHDYTLDRTYDYKHTLSGAGGERGYIYDMVVYGSEYSRLYIELDGPDHKAARDKKKEARAGIAKAKFERFSFDEGKNISHDGQKISDDQIFVLICANLEKQALTRRCSVYLYLKTASV